MAAKCVHQSCGKEFFDTEETCFYHPGPPVFHEGLKGWKCCKPRVLTFDEFLSITPCTTGKHSTTDIPPTIEKKEAQIANIPPPKTAFLSDHISRSPISTVPQATATPPPAPQESEDDDPQLELPVGKICRRRACGTQFDGGARRDEQCVFHPGVPIFHEGSKGYSCCKRRVLEFDEFMKIRGCATKDRHLFIGSGQKERNASGKETLESVRHDFYQTPTTVIASFFLKKIDKAKSQVRFGPSELALDLKTTDATPKCFTKSFSLFGQIDPLTSTFKVFGTKLEVNFTKMDGASWPVLCSNELQTGEIIQVGRAGNFS
ncbi:hypothetical protein K3495_g1389 [Podosphaera aphanis]|nr:hypothetical protein K3495_g1389 [Podosphaera aphanis]